MSIISVEKIEVSNPLLSTYVKQVSKWNKKNHLKLTSNGEYNPFYAIYYDEHFLGASTIRLNRKGIPNISVLNWSVNDHNLIQSDGISQLCEIAKEEYNTEKYKLLYKKVK